MRLVAAIAVLVFAGCAQTVIYEAGQPVMRMQADAQNVTLRTARGTYFHADVIIHSAPTLAGGQAANGVINAAGAAVVGGIVAAGNPVPAVIATGVPAVVGSAQGIVRPQTTNLYIQHQWADPTSGTRVKVKHHRRHRRHRAIDAPPKD